MEHSISKTTLGDLVAGSRSVYWTDGDCISANGVTSQALSGVGNNASTALFSFPSDPGTPYKLVYPASIWEADGRVTLPTVLNASSGAFDGLMYGYSADGGEATMHHMTAYARINVKKGAEEHTLRYVRLTGGAKEQLSGRFDIQYSTGELSPDDVSAAATKVFATVNATLTDEPTSVLIPVPEGTYSSGFTVRLVDSEGHYMDKSRGASVFEAGHIYNLDAFTFTPTGTLVTIDLPDTEEEAEQDLSPDEIASSISSYLSTSYPASVTSVSVSSTSVTIKGTAPTSSGYYLAEITPYQEVSTLSAFPYKTSLSSASFTVTLSRTVSRKGFSYDRLLSKWAVVDASGNLCSHAHFADEVAAVSSPAAVVLSSKKGLGGYSGQELQTSDLDNLGIGSVTVNILLNGVINTEKTGGYTTAYTYGGATYYIDENYVSGLDATLKECASRNIVVAGILLVANSATSAGTAIMKHPESTGGYYSMPNMKTAESVNLYAAALTYLMSRYNGGSFGRVHHWIMHNEVDAQLTWTNMGEQPQKRYVNEYVKSMRMASLIAKQYDSGAAVLASLTHAWAVAENEYAPKELLDDLNALCDAEGDFWWGVGYHCYPQILFQPAFWSGDTESTYSTNTAYVTFRNLEVLSDWALSSKNQYKGSTKRIVFLSENGTNAMSYSDDHLSQQAAGVCWAWKKIQALEGIDAMQWHAWRDNPEEGLNLGLRKNTDNGSATKPAWDAYQAAGTSSEDSVFAPYLPVIGISSWDQIML